jgi:5-methylcytosine-specific restriction endonuclease McrA
MKGKILKLNKNYFPIGTADKREVIKNMFSGAVWPLDITYALDENGKITGEIECMIPVKTWEEWSQLEVRPYDDFIRAPKAVYRLPSVVICAEYGQIKFGKTLFPTKKNIWERDNYTCCYTGKRLTKDELSIDHIIPSSRGGDNSWLNLVTCDRELNRKKSDRTPEEANLKLIQKPFVPKNKNNLVFNSARPEWAPFIL